MALLLKVSLACSRGSAERKQHIMLMRSTTEWARSRIAKDHKFRRGAVYKLGGEIIAGVAEKVYS